MKTIAYLAIVVGALSLIGGIISKWLLTPVALVPGGLEAGVLLAFTNTCLLVAIAFILLAMLKGKE
ncbi:MAG: hypothetical protein U9R31_04400 [Candidatus Omnitrophota bacterium]|nr:hypothetical protein [Candidatus Omnitrophota bacterium]